MNEDYMMETILGTTTSSSSSSEIIVELDVVESNNNYNYSSTCIEEEEEEDINRLFDSIFIRPSSHHRSDEAQNSAMKRPLRLGYYCSSASSSHTSANIGISSQPVSLKQALRGLCISQASELAAMKRLAKPKPKPAASKDHIVLRSTDVHIPHIMIQNLGLSDKTSSATLDVVVDSSSPVKLSNGESHSESLPSRGRCLGNSVSYSPRFIKPVFRNKMKKKAKQDFTYVSSSKNVSNDSHGQSYSMKSGRTQDFISSPLSSCTNDSSEINSSTTSTSCSKPALKLNCSKSRSKEKSEFSPSFKSSIGEYSSSTTSISTTSISEESILSGFTRGGSRPHMSKDSRWEAIHCVEKQQGSLSLKQFKLLRKLGSGDIGNVYLAELIDTNYLFSLKVMDNEFLVCNMKMSRAQTEREILQLLDHPFLPTLYAHFSTDKLSCLVMEYCPAGDLHVLRQKQPGRSYYEEAARFYVAEVLLALEYLHMLGVVYRDLKPENVLVREDGHIMLTDFDLSLRCTANSVLVKSSPPLAVPPKNTSGSCSESTFCLNPSFQVPCFAPRHLSIAAKSRKTKPDLAMQVSPLPQIIVEPTSARSNSFVGTYEYFAPEIIKGEGHGSEVDWWTFGIFLFELLYGRTPFKGSTNEETLSKVVSENLKFPNCHAVSFHARDLIRGLLIKDPENRLGSVKGAAEIKQHPFFKDINWALIRCAVPPQLPNCSEPKVREEHMELETF